VRQVGQLPRICKRSLTRCRCINQSGTVIDWRAPVNIMR